jgi:hypothetical protein
MMAIAEIRGSATRHSRPWFWIGIGGDYSICMGMYRVDTMERLPVQGDTGGENALCLGQITVMPGSQR